jgi:alpha-L-arabinofuranosidase
LTRIAIDPARPVGRLDRKVFGGFVEHLGRCIYGGLYEEGSPLSDDRGFRKDVLGLLRELRLGVLQPHQAERAILCTRALIERAAYRQKLAAPPRIAYDEWNVWYRQMTGALEERYAFADALAVGTYLNIFTRNCDWVQMANLAQMVNAIAPIVTSPEAAAVQPIWKRDRKTRRTRWWPSGCHPGRSPSSRPR